MWLCLHYTDLYCTWTCLHRKGLSCTWTGQQEPVLLLDVYTTKGPELQLNVSAQNKFAALGHVYTLKGPDLHLDGYRLQKHVLLPGLANTTEFCAAPGRVNKTEAWAAPRRVWTREACAAPGCVSATEAWDATGLFYTTEAFAAPGCVYATGAWDATGLVWTTGAWAAPVLLLDLSTLKRPVLHLVVAKQGPELHLDMSEHLEPLRVSLWKYMKFCIGKSTEFREILSN
jgi:hypothetical protein